MLTLNQGFQLTSVWMWVPITQYIKRPIKTQIRNKMLLIFFGMSSDYKSKYLASIFWFLLLFILTTNSWKPNTQINIPTVTHFCTKLEANALLKSWKSSRIRLWSSIICINLWFSSLDVNFSRSFCIFLKYPQMNIPHTRNKESLATITRPTRNEA